MIKTASAALSSIGKQHEPLGFSFVLILIYLVMEYARPANPMKIPMLISILLFLNWLAIPEKRWNPQIKCFLILLCLIAVMGPFAVNNYSIFWGFVDMAVELLCICIPIIHFVNSMRKLSILINGLLAVYVYVAIYGLMHSGMGPGGHIGDENDLALALNMVIPYAFVSIFLTKSNSRKALFIGVFALLVFGVIGTFSRGGFLGLLPVLLYCSVLTPRKALALVLVLFVSLGVWIFSPDKYWTEMGTIVEEADNPELGTGGLRRQYWAMAMRMFYENPIFGVGLENYNHNIDIYEPEDQYLRVGRSFHGMSAHSLYFTLLAELGVSGALIFGAIIWFNTKDTKAIIKASYSNRERLKSPRKRETRHNSWENTIPTAHEARLADLNKARFYAHAMRASLLGYLTSAAFISVFTYPHFWLLTAMIVALKEVTANLVKSPAESEGQETDLGRRVSPKYLKLRESEAHHPV